MTVKSISRNHSVERSRSHRGSGRSPNRRTVLRDQLGDTVVLCARGDATPAKASTFFHSPEYREATDRGRTHSGKLFSARAGPRKKC